MPGRTVFVSYSHVQGQWVWGRLKPILDAAGVTVLIDREHFEAGKDLDCQEAAVQERAEASILVLSPDYLRSRPCLAEMDRAIMRDPRFARGETIPILRVDCDLPREFTKPLYVDLRDDGHPEPWAKLLDACGASLGCIAPDWLTARDAVATALARNQSVNLVADPGTPWLPLIEAIRREHLPSLVVVNLERGATASRRGLIEAILYKLGSPRSVPAPPDDLVVLDMIISQRGLSLVALTHFDLVPFRPDYDINLFSALRCLMDDRKLVLLAHSREQFASLLPANHLLSAIQIEQVRLPGRA